jgi:thiol-disulfide isomerase/thioredoxin
MRNSNGTDIHNASRGRLGAARVAALLATCVALAAFGGATSASPQRPGGDDHVVLTDSARRHVLHAMDGKGTSLASLKGEVVVVNFWASWCKPCQREMPALAALHTELAQKGGCVVAISIDEDARNAQEFVRLHHFQLPVYHDGPNGLAKQLDLPYVPYTMILDRSGDVVFTSGGGDEHALNELCATARRFASTPQLASQTQGGDAK